MYERVCIFWRKTCVANRARFQRGPCCCVENTDTTLPASEAAPSIYMKLTSRASTRKLPILKFLYSYICTFQQVLILKIRNGNLIAFFQCNPGAKHERIIGSV